MKRIGITALLICAALAVACTSNQSSTQPLNSDSQWADNYRQESRSAQEQERADQGSDAPREDPPVTIMLLAMETGDVFPGDDYFVYAVVDNPDNRDLEYVWSVSDGDINEVPEAERGRLAGIVEEEYDNIGVPLPTEQPAVETGAVETPPGTEGQPADGSTDAGTAPPGSSLPGGATTSDQTTERPLQPTGGGSLPADSGEQPSTQAAEVPGGTELPPSGVPVAVNPADQPRVNDLWNEIQGLEIEIRQINEQKTQAINDQDQARVDELANQIADLDRTREEKLNELAGLIGKESRDTAGLPLSRMVGSVLERRVVSGAECEEEVKDETTSENVELLAEQLAQGVAEGGAELSATGGSDANVAEIESTRDAVSWIGNEPLDLPSTHSSGIRTEYNAWKDDSGEPRRRNLGGYGDADLTEPLLEEESYEVYTFVTGEPYIQWTPRLPGNVNIYVKATYKDEGVTESRVLPVEVRLRDPAVDLSEDFPDVVREDESIYIALEGTNLPTFYKGLFTLNFDATKLSFREAELGEFFDDVPSASLFYSQPDKLAGKLLLAVDSNLKLGELGGNGPLVYVKFKAKQDLTDREETQLSMVMDTSARYILSREGENILPLPVARAPFRSDTMLAPELPEYGFERRPGSNAQTQTPALGGEQLPAAGTGSQVPSTGQGSGSYIPPAGETGRGGTANTGGTQPTTGGTTLQPNMGTPGGGGTGALVESGGTQTVAPEPTEQQQEYTGDPVAEAGTLPVTTSEADDENGIATTEDETATAENSDATEGEETVATEVPVEDEADETAVTEEDEAEAEETVATEVPVEEEAD